MLAFETSLPRAGEYYDTSEDFFEKFAILMGRTTQSVFKLETMQTYQEPGNPSFEAFQRGDFDEAVRLCWTVRQQQERDHSVMMCQKAISWTRIHLVEKPLTDYLKWELETYNVSVKYGERILIADITDQQQGSYFRKLTDFIIFDDRAVMAHNYDRDGLIQGGWIVDQPSQVQKYSEAIKACSGISLPLGVFQWESQSQ